MRSGVLTGNDIRWCGASSGSPLPERTDGYSPIYNTDFCLSSAVHTVRQIIKSLSSVRPSVWVCGQVCNDDHNADGDL